MKLKFDPSLEYQRDAVNAVVGVFEGLPLAGQVDIASIQSLQVGGLFRSELGISNNFTLTDKQFLANVHKIQKANNIEKVSSLQGRNFSVEMETGTGKTYVYLRTIFELSKRYGLKKIIIVVPSVAVREGVLKSIDMTREHFRTLYDNVPFDAFAYDSKKLGRVRQFASGNQIQIMVINIQSFQKDVVDGDASQMTDDEIQKLNVINRENDRMSGHKPIEFLRATNPIVIIDEPQSVDNTPKAKSAIANLNPSVILRYSATHRESYNLLYKLDPVRAYDMRLVKRIEVDSVRSDDSFNDAYVKFIKADYKKGIKAQLGIHQKKKGNIKFVKVWVRLGDDLYAKSGDREIYQEGYIVQDINCEPGHERVEFSNGKSLEPGRETGGLGDDIMKEQVRQTVEQHLEKERALKGKGIKVLSLFFIDKVANYRVYNDEGPPTLGKIGQWFEEAYQKLTAKPIYEEFAAEDVAGIHNGYFSEDRRGRAKDTQGKGRDDEDAYALIMKDKERLLDPQVPLRFIFSHSALREGWDNPNVFQICTLNESRSTEKKRQEIGRGLRLPVNKDGERVHDKSINRLTIIANESYEEFARSLQKELEEDFGIQFKKYVVSSRNRRTIKLRKLSEDFKLLWDKIKHRTRYRVAFDTDDLIDQAVKRIMKLDVIRPVYITTTRVGLEISIDEGVKTDRVLGGGRRKVDTVQVLPDLLTYLQKETELTRDTLMKILRRSGRLKDFLINPQQFMTLAAREISYALHDIVLAGIQYEKIDNHFWEMMCIEEEAGEGIVRFLENLYEVQNHEKCPFDAIEFESEGEKKFAEALDNHDDVKLFFKLPGWFKIDTPVGPYNPDWAFVTEYEKKLYFVRETKDTRDRAKLRSEEARKVACGARHFEAIGVDYDVVTNLGEVNLRG